MVPVEVVMRKYHTEVIILPKSLPRVRVIEDTANFDLYGIEKDKLIPLMAQWCIENDCGYRSCYDTFKFRNKHQMLLFLLKWGK